MSNTAYEIRSTGGQYLREPMRTATEADVEEVLILAAMYIGESGTIEWLDGGDVVLGALVARPVHS